MLDFRSDTVTRPTSAMRRAMAEAEVGDDVFGDDPTVQRLQAMIAERLGKEAALFVPSGTMANQIAVRLHCRPGDELICEAGSHVYYYEQGGYAQLSGVAVRPVAGRDGVMELAQLQSTVRPDDPHFPRTRLVSLENTHNRGGGRILPQEGIEAIAAWARGRGLRTHLDGARLFNAAVASGIEPLRLAAPFDTVSVCFSKGLGAPVGSAICGPRDLVAEAVRHRKVLGGGWRQAGILAAAAIYALEHHVGRLADDHALAQRLAEGIRQIPHLSLVGEPIQTNIFYFEVDRTWGPAAKFAAALREKGLGMLAAGEQTMRAVTHLDVGPKEADQALEILRVVAEG